MLSSQYLALIALSCVTDFVKNKDKYVLLFVTHLL